MPSKQALHDLCVIGDLKIRNDRLAVFLDLHIVGIIGADRNGRVDDVGNDHHILENDLIRFLLDLVEFFQAVRHRVYLGFDCLYLGHQGRILLGLAHQRADLFGEFVPISAELVRLVLRSASLLIILDHFVDERKLHVLKFLADILFNDLRILSQKLNINHLLSPSFVPALFFALLRAIL